MATANLRIVNAMNGMTLCDDNVDNIKYGKVASKGGDPHECDGTNNNENPFPGPTCTNVLNKGTNGNWVGVYYPNMEDFLIKEILDVQAGDNTYWSLWLNYKYMTVGGCQAQIKNHDSVLWALIPTNFDPSGAIPSSIPLKLKGPRTAKKDVEILVTVIDGPNGPAAKNANVKAINGTSVVTATTDQYGGAMLKLTATGEYTVTATKGTDIPSNLLKVTVTA